MDVACVSSSALSSILLLLSSNFVCWAQVGERGHLNHRKKNYGTDVNEIFADFSLHYRQKSVKISYAFVPHFSLEKIKYSQKCSNIGMEIAGLETRHLKSGWP